MVKHLMLDLESCWFYVQRRRPNYMETAGVFHAVMNNLAELDEERQAQRERDRGCW